MKLKRKLLNDSKGYTLIELVIVILLLGIIIGPVYKMVTSGAKIQKASEETYEATLQAQSLLQSVKDQIEIDLGDEYRTNRKIASVGVQPWLELPVGPGFNTSLIDFVSVFKDPAALAADPVLRAKKDAETLGFRTKYKTKDFLYEVHIWHLEAGELKKKAAPAIGTEPPISFVEYDPSLTPGVSVPVFDESNTSDFTMVEINTAIKDYFGNKESLLWTNPETVAPGVKDPKAIGEITYKRQDEITIIGNGIDPSVDNTTDTAEGVTSINITPITGYQVIPEVIKLTYERYSNTPTTKTQRLIINDVGPGLTSTDVIQLSVDLTTFVDLSGPPVETKVIRIENNTKAKVVVPVYNESNHNNIEIYPIQTNKDGNIVVENRKKREPSKNFVIGIIVKDAYNSTFGKANKILSKIVDIYSYDYNNQPQ